MGILQRARSPSGHHQYSLVIKKLNLIGKGSFGYVYQSDVKIEDPASSEAAPPIKAAIKFCMDANDYTELDILKLMPEPDPWYQKQMSEVNKINCKI